MNTEASQYGINPEYWDRLSERDQALYRLVRPLRSSVYSVDVPLGYLERHIDGMAADAQSTGGSLQLNPDFQRGHVWDEARQVAYIENLFRGVAPTVLRFNCASWGGRDQAGDINPGDIVCVDGLQRLTAVRRFMKGEFKIFGNEDSETLRGTQFDPNRMSSFRLSIQMFDISWRQQLLQFYLDINRGGVVHTEEELARVEEMMTQPAGSEVVVAAVAPKAKSAKRTR